MCMMIHETMVEGILILRQGLINGCLICLLKFSLVKVVELLYSGEARCTCACWPCCSLWHLETGLWNTQRWNINALNFILLQ